MASAYDGPIVDVDIHHGWKRREDILPYLPQRWREFATANPDVSVLPGKAARTSVFYNFGIGRRDSIPPDGSPGGTDYPFMKEQLLDRYNIWRGVLTYNTGGHVNGFNREYALAVARAVHDWNADTWLSWDERLYGVVCAPSSWPEEAAKEIRRVGPHPKIAAVLLAGCPLNRAFGDPVYHPIYEAASELGLPVQVHVGVVQGENPPGGLPLSGTAGVTCESQQPMHHITSLIVHGVFEKFPNLKFVIKEFGQAWLPYLMWRLDANYEVLRLESPWVKRLPSEYIREHVRLDTQPLEEGWERDDLEQVLTTIDDVEDMLCFATDYPHSAFDDPNYVISHLPQRWLRKVMCDNACDCYGWTPPPADAVFQHEPALAAAGD